jgi:UDP-3-O-[3-hydroxymyristoyl] N-acetylglucosamine deacetylase
VIQLPCDTDIQQKGYNMRQQQRTLAKPVSFSGKGVHSGKTVRAEIHPAPANHGIQFVRKDLPDSPGVKAHFNQVVDTSLATVIGSDGCIVSTIEHLMATFAGLAVDNALIELDGYEIPIMDGSASVFAEKIRKTGFQDQDGPKCYFVLKRPIALKEGDKSVVVYPSSKFRITYTIEFPHPLIQKQTYSLDVTENRFAEEISRARTFGFYQEVEYMKRFGLARGGSLDNAVVIGEKDVLNDGGLRFPDEFVRHKILDAIGDFSLLGLPILGHLVIKKSGHAFNHAFLKTFFKQKNAWETLTLHNIDDARTSPPNAIAV